MNPPQDQTGQMPVAQVGIGAAVVSHRGEMLGYVGAVYVHDVTGRAAWASVARGRHTAVVPLERSRFDGARLHVPFDAEQLRSAPHHDPATLISDAEGGEFARHYGLLPTTASQPAPAAPAASGDVAAGEGSAGAENAAMIGSAEQLRVDGVNVVVGRARLVKYIVTEQQTFTIPVRREQVRIEYDPLPVEEQTLTATAPAEEVYEVVCRAEQVMFTTQVVPVERVRMIRHVHTTAQAITEQLRAEQIELQHLDTAGRDDGPRDTPGEGEMPWG